ncbi:MAG TPA: RDD family protein [Candidatus Dormibacteraeota bacterium]
MAEVQLRDEVRGPAPADLKTQRDSYWVFLERLCLGLVRFRGGTIYGLGLPLIRMSEPDYADGFWRWRIEGGLLAARPGGELCFGAENGHLVGYLRGYRPTIPEPLYGLTQRPVHRLITRLFLLHLRGRRNPPGVPAAPAARLAATAIDAVLLMNVARLLPRRARPLAAVAYFAGAWTVTGRTPGERALGLRVVAADGSAVTLGQALLRAVLAPAALVTRRAVHDEVAGTEVVVDQ